jgi:hypothetical protein
VTFGTLFIDHPFQFLVWELSWRPMNRASGMMPREAILDLLPGHFRSTSKMTLRATQKLEITLRATQNLLRQPHIRGEGFVRSHFGNFIGRCCVWNFVH